MIWTEELPLLALSVIILYSLQLLVEAVLQIRSQPKVWSKLETVGISSGGPFRWAWAIVASVTSTRTYAAEGYNKISKGLRLPFAIPTTWTGRAVVVMPPSNLHYMLTRPDKLAKSEITNIFGLIETIQLPYMITDPDIYMNALHFDVVRRKMTKKDMNFFAGSQAEEIDLAFSEIWGTSREWTTINGWDGCGRIIARAAQRMMLGLPMGRDTTLLDASRLYANSALLGGAVMNCFPPWARKVVAPVIALRAKYYQRRCVNILAPIIDERIRIFRKTGEGEGNEQTDQDVPDDFLQWLVATCGKDGEHQLHSYRIAHRLIALMTPLIFAVCYMFAHSVLDLYGSAAKEEFLSGLEAECTRVSALYNGLETAEAVDELYRVDSAIRESMRVSDVSVINLYRDVTSGELDLGNGIVIPQGVRMAFPTQNIHLDPDNYEDPQSFDAFRFSRKFEGLNDQAQQQKSERELIVTPTTSFLPLGYGRHACPGRWFAAQTMKQALAYIIEHYDVELMGEPVKRTALLNTMVPPTDKLMKIRRKS